MIEPTQDRILAERLPEPPRRIILTDAEAFRYFKVIAVGPKVREVKAGQTIALPGVASDYPDHIIEQGQFIREADIGFIIQ